VTALDGAATGAPTTGLPATDLAPPITPPGELDLRLAQQGFAVLDARGLHALAGLAPGSLARWERLWDDLPPDLHLRDGGRYRRRRHGSFVVEHGALRQVPHRAHWQSLDYNALHGGIERWFEPLDPALTADPAWSALLAGLARVAGRLRGEPVPYVEAHAFRIDTRDGIGRPTPEGAHRDGVDLVAVILVARRGIKGGETRVFDARGPAGLRFTIAEPWSVLLLDDERVVHESTPIQPADPARADAAAPGARDTLVLTFRRGGFQGPAGA
jgi:hypothetical protein